MISCVPKAAGFEYMNIEASLIESDSSKSMRWDNLTSNYQANDGVPDIVSRTVPYRTTMY